MEDLHLPVIKNGKRFFTQVSVTIFPPEFTTSVTYERTIENFIMPPQGSELSNLC